MSQPLTQGVYLGLERLAHDEDTGAIGAISALLAPSAKVPPSPFPSPSSSSTEIPPRLCRVPRRRRRL